MRRRKYKNKKIMLTAFILLICLTVGYSAFNTIVNLKAKGNIYNKVDLCYTTSDNGDGTVTITDYDKTCGTEVNIPSTIKGKTITKIEEYAFQNKGLTTVTFPNTLTDIGKSAFTDNKLKELEIPASVTEIGAYAFRYMLISKLTLHEGLKYIGLDAFQNNYISEISIPSTVTYIGGGAFAANSVTGDKAFIYGRNSDGSTDYTKLSSYAGKDATGTTIPDTVTTIMPEAYYLVRYEEIDIPSKIKDIPGLCFNNSHATKITLHEGLEKIYNGAFGGSDMQSIDIPSTITYISDTAFSCSWNGCSNHPTLKTININKSANSIAGAPWGSNATVNWLG